MPRLKRPPGGSLPEGWEFFRPAADACWFLKQSHPGMYSVLGLCPCKTPLDEVFDRHRLKINETVETTSTAHLGNEERTELERLRKTTFRYTSSWRPRDIALFLGDRWLPGRGVGANVRAVINLCATERYYNPFDFQVQGIQYFWQKIEGGGRIPSLEDLSDLKDLWHHLWDDYAMTVEADSLHDLHEKIRDMAIRLPVVLIHCTHGVNRTGFCVAALALFHTKHACVIDVTDLFGKVRGHSINRPELIDGLSSIFRSILTRDNGRLLYIPDLTSPKRNDIDDKYGNPNEDLVDYD